MWKFVFAGLLALLAGQSNANPCDSIQCKGPLFEMVQLRNIFGDNKKFVDRATKYSPDAIMEKFNLLGSDVKNHQLLEFVRDNFFAPGFELEAVTPSDWIEEPDVLLKQRNPQLLEIATEAHNLWLKLTRQVNMSRLPEDSVSTLIPVKHPFVVPGGRFTEAYYWDTYFSIEGLLASQMPETTKNMIKNFVDEIMEFGFIPNGFRKYFRNRSQPPFLLHIMNAYYEHTSEDKLIFDSLPAFDKEYNFFMKERSINLNGNNRLNIYRLFTDEPRIESFREDYEIAQTFGDDEEKRNHFFSSITAACESGWDFSSRWLNLAQLAEQNGERDLSTIDTTNLIPVDLNALMYYNERTLQKFNCKYARGTQARSAFMTKCYWYGRQARNRFRLMEKMLLNENGWSDRNVTSGKNRNEQKVRVNFLGQLDPNGDREITPLYVSDLAPLYFMDEEWRTNDVRRHESESISRQEKEISEKIKKINSMVMDKLITGVDDILDSLENGGDMEAVTMNEWQELLLKHPNGVPISNINSGEQWDLPNGWSPYQFLLIKTLIRFHEENFGQNPTYKRLALHLATKWLQTNYCAFKANGGFYEKYSVTGPRGELGGGGEYKVVEGFGWTNGLILYLADKLPEIELESKCPSD